MRSRASRRSIEADEKVVKYHILNVFNIKKDGGDCFCFKCLTSCNIVPPQVAKENTWWPKNCFKNIYPENFRRNTNLATTDCLRGSVGFTSGLHVWRVKWNPKTKGDHSMVGIAVCPKDRKSASVSEYWAWDLINKKLWHNLTLEPHTDCATYPQGVKDTWHVPVTFYLILDMAAGTLAFSTNRRFFGVAFRGLKGENLCPILCTQKNDRIRMQYFATMEGPPTLAQICLRVIASYPQLNGQEVIYLGQKMKLRLS